MDMRQSDLGLLLALDALLAERNVTRAARRLNISQPAMSAQLARLRDLFSDPLLVASGRQMVPTALAVSLQGELHLKLLELTQLVRERQPFDPSSTSRIFRIIAPDYLHTVVSVPLIREASRVTSNVQIVLLPFERSLAWRMLENLEADLLLMWRQLTPEEARATPLFREQLCFVQRKNHPRGKKNPTVEELCQFPHAIIAPDAGSLWGVVDDELQKLGRARHVVASLPSFMAVPALVASTDLVAAIPRKLAETTSERLNVFDLPLENMDFEILMSWHPRMHGDPGHEWLRKRTSAVPANK